MIALVVIALTGALVVLVVLAANALAAATDPMPALDMTDRPGDDDQWSELADAMRRYRRHKLKGRHRG